MTTRAAFSFHGKVLKDERALFISVALGTGGIAGGHVANVAQGGGTVEIVTVRALQEAFVHTVVERFGELRFGRGVALVAELRLGLRKEAMLFLRVMRRMAVQAADVIVGMRRAIEVHLTFAVRMTSQTACTGLLPGEFLEADDLANVATARHVLAPRPVTGFTALPAL
jgi:hypothetical protein